MPVLKINDIYRKYFQKSKVFLYPALGIKRSSITPVNTHMSWEGVFTLEDYQLGCVFYLRDDSEFLSFEENSLMKNRHFVDYKEIDHEKAVYIFDMYHCAEDFEAVLEGRYSEISDQTKSMIRASYGANSHNYAFINSYLYPEKHFDLYAKFLTTCKEDVPAMDRLLRDVGELCDKPDLDKENLKSTVKVLDLG